MATVLTQFQVEVPLASNQAQQDAIDTFRANMTTLGPIYENDMYRYVTDGLVPSHAVFSQQSHFMSGYLTVAQQPTALGFLTALNTAFGTTVLCTIDSITTEP